VLCDVSVSVPDVFDQVGSRRLPDHLSSRPDHLIDPLHLGDGSQDALQLICVRDHNLKGIRGLLIPEGPNMGPCNVHLRAGNGRAYGGQKSRPVNAAHLDLDRPRSLSLFLPIHLHLSMGVALQDR